MILRGAAGTAEGSASPREATRQCPAGMALKEVRVRAGQFIQRLELACQDINNLTGVVEQGQQPIGSPDRQFPLDSSLAYCAGRGALVGLTYDTSSVVDRLGGQCATITTTNGVDASSVARHLLPAEGGGSGQSFFDDCPADSALVGLRGRAGSLIDAVQGVCAPVAAWSNTALPAPATQALTMRGGSGGSPIESMCPRGMFVRGWEIISQQPPGFGRVIADLALHCRDF